MSSAEPDFPTELIQQDVPISELEERYRAELFKLMYRQLPTRKRWVGGVMSVLYFVFGIAVMELDPRRIPAEATLLRQVLHIAGAALVLMSVMVAWISIRGRYDRRAHGAVMMLFTLLICGGMGLSFMNMAWDTDDLHSRGPFLLAGTTLLLAGVGAICGAIVQELHWQTQEKILRLECRIADLAAELLKRN